MPRTLHLARLLRLDEIITVAIPSIDREAVRDLIRAREDCRSNLIVRGTGCRN